MNIRKSKLCVFTLLIIVLSSSYLVQTSCAASKQDVLSLAQKILSDPMLPDAYKKSTISGKISHKPSKEEGWESYGIIINGSAEPHSRISLFERNSSTYDFSLFLTGFDDYNDSLVPDWNKMVPKWDAFVESYWPGMHRTSDWKSEIWRRSGSGTFTIQYVLTKRELVLFKVSLRIRLSDGKIGGIDTRDVRFLFKGKKIPPPPTAEQIISLVRNALKEKQYSTALNLTNAKFSIHDVERWAQPITNTEAQIFDSGNINVVDAKGNTYIIVFYYHEDKQATKILNIETQQEIDDFRQKPLTQVDDKQPFWSADGKHLYFITSRRAKDQPWWTPIAFQYAIAVNQVGTDNLQYISPLKTKHGDYGLYQSPQVSPGGQYLAAGLGGDEANLFILDLQKGILHIPERDPAFLIRQQKKLGLPDEFLRMTQSMFRSDGNKYPWISKGLQWLANDGFLYLGRLDGGGEQIFLARKTSNAPGQIWDVWPVYQKQGEETLLCLSSDEKVLSWAHQEPAWQKTKDDKDTSDKPSPWQFVTADFDAIKPSVGNLTEVNLPDKPTSISWDSKHKRWLIVTEKNELLWIQRINGKLTATKVLLSLTWNNNKLRPTSAAISPDGNSIALAAELEKPIAYPKTECVIHSLIFNWDGKSTSVKPFYDPSLNGIPRYIFPATNSPWAKVEGDLKKFGLQDVVDPNFATSPVPTNVAP